MSITIATRGIIGGFSGVGGGSIVYVDVPVCATGPTSEEVGNLTMIAVDPDAVSAPPNPTIGDAALPRRKGTIIILPTKNTYSVIPS